MKLRQAIKIAKNAERYNKQTLLRANLRFVKCRGCEEYNWLIIKAVCKIDYARDTKHIFQK